MNLDDILLAPGTEGLASRVAARDDTDTSEDAVIPGVALAAEAGARLGPTGFVVPVDDFEALVIPLHLIGLTDGEVFHSQANFPWLRRHDRKTTR